jgi:hypothetical protein
MSSEIVGFLLLLIGVPFLIWLITITSDKIMYEEIIHDDKCMCGNCFSKRQGTKEVSKLAKKIAE